jgi:hypothetical protein
MPELSEGSLTFSFPETWVVSKYDQWPYYKNQFKDSCLGNKAVDFMAFDPQNGTLWMIEVKDYRIHGRTKTLSIWDEIALKTRDTLAGLVSAIVHKEYAEFVFVRLVTHVRKFRVVLHLEQPAMPSKLFPRPFDNAKLQQKIKQLIKPIDAHPKVMSISTISSSAWQVKKST